MNLALGHSCWYPGHGDIHTEGGIPFSFSEAVLICKGAGEV